MSQLNNALGALHSTNIGVNAPGDVSGGGTIAHVVTTATRLGPVRGGGGMAPNPTAPVSDPESQKEPCRIPPLPPGESVDRNIQTAIAQRIRIQAMPFPPLLAPNGRQAVTLGYFYAQVHNGGPWDYKQRGKQFIPGGNFNYGATGTALGLSRQVLFRAAGAAQIVAGTSQDDFGNPLGEYPYGDDYIDQPWISAGIEYAENCAKNQ